VQREIFPASVTLVTATGQKTRIPLRKLRITLAIILTAILILSTSSGSFLVVNDLQPADVIVVLAGETRERPKRGVQLLSENYAPKMLLDVPVAEIIYNVSSLDIARAYIQQLPERQSVSICPIFGLSTKTEAQDVARCLEQSGVRRILLVTSDYHTRRARSIFAHELRGYQVFVTPAYDRSQFGAAWWRHRQWAKINFSEWVRLVWWELVDRWR
jgi:uncharacterized SAM-binding protein YcdF (DUF218 family)